MLERNRLSPADEAKAIKIGAELEALKKHPGWSHIQEFIRKNEEGLHEAMKKNTATLGLWGIFPLINSFAKYLMALFEIRAYNKINTYVDVTIANGKRRFAEQNKREGRA